MLPPKRIVIIRIVMDCFLRATVMLFVALLIAAKTLSGNFNCPVQRLLADPAGDAVTPQRS